MSTLLLSYKFSNPKNAKRYQRWTGSHIFMKDLRMLFVDVQVSSDNTTKKGRSGCFLRNFEVRTSICSQIRIRERSRNKICFLFSYLARYISNNNIYLRMLNERQQESTKTLTGLYGDPERNIHPKLVRESCKQSFFRFDFCCLMATFCAVIFFCACLKY